MKRVHMVEFEPRIVAGVALLLLVPVAYYLLNTGRTVVALSLVGFLAVGVLPYVAWWALGFDLWYAFVVSFVGAWVTNAVLVVALYFDSIHVRLNSGWHPNPSVAAGVGTLLAFVPGLAALYGVYHLGRRQVTDGL